MNYFGSYRQLLKNSKSALLAAIEIYNKPRIDYRDECFVILLLNAWELGAKALLSKNRKSIFYPKLRNQPYRTYSMADALKKAKPFFPVSVSFDAASENIELLSIYRDNSVHFYNEPDFGVIVFSLAQTAIINLKDLYHDSFGFDLESEISWRLMPPGIHAPVDPIAYIGSKTPGPSKSPAVREFLAEIVRASDRVRKSGGDEARLMTIFTVKLESTKNLEDADVVAGVQKTEDAGLLVIHRRLDPNETHKYRQTEILKAVPALHGRKLTSNTFHAIVWKHGVRKNRDFYWQSEGGELKKYSKAFLDWLNNLAPRQIDEAVREYKTRNARRQKRKTKSRS